MSISKKLQSCLAAAVPPIAVTAFAKLMPTGVTLRLLERVVADVMTRDTLADLPDGMHVLLAGAGCPLPDIRRSGPCVAVQAGEHLYVVDAGTNGARNLSRFVVDVGRVEAVLLTHVHSDHIDGLGELGMLRWLNALVHSPLPVHGPPVISEVVAGFNQAYAPDVEYRVAHQGVDFAPPSGSGLEACPYPMPSDGELHTVLETPDGVRVSAFLVSHEPVSEAVGYRIDYKGRSIVLSGDTTKSPNLIRHAQGVDLLVHEALDTRLTERIARAAQSAGNSRAAKMMSDVASYHTTPRQAAETAAEVGAAHLLFYHVAPQLPSPALERIFLQGVRDAYGGKITLGTDGTLISIPARR